MRTVFTSNALLGLQTPQHTSLGLEVPSSPLTCGISAALAAMKTPDQQREAGIEQLR